MYDCPICKTRHAENPEICRRRRDEPIQRELSQTFERILKEHGNTPEIRLVIAEYTFGYLGASFGLHVK